MAVFIATAQSVHDIIPHRSIQLKHNVIA